MGWEGLTVIKEIRHNERLREPFDFQSVAIVRSDHTRGLQNLRGSDFCHPGLHYERHQKWSERFLKHFERTLIKPSCSTNGQSPAEQEAAGLSSFFNAACRPGAWSNNPQEDEKLKAKYPKLCSLCDNTENCSYNNDLPMTSHNQALECVKKSGNAVTYVALKEAQDFFETNSNIAHMFSFLCPNGSLQAITDNDRPCVWLSQPWKLIVSTNEKAIGLSTTLGRWMTSSGSWESSLRQILVPDDSSIVAVNNILRLTDYITPIRPIPISLDTDCPAAIRWCTHSYEEKEKCDVLRAAGLTTGIIPSIICNSPRSDTVSCISDVNTNKADFVGIDSNFGYIARK